MIEKSSLFEKVNDDLYRAGIYGTVSLSPMKVCEVTFQPMQRVIFTRPDGIRFNTSIIFSLEAIQDCEWQGVNESELASILLQEVKDWVSRDPSKLGRPAIVKAR